MTWGLLPGCEPPLGTRNPRVRSHANVFSFPFSSFSPENPLQRNLRQMVSERQLPCTRIPLQTPSASGTPPPIPPARHSHLTLPSYWPPFILSPFPSLCKMISRKHILPLSLGGSGDRSGRAERSGRSTPPPPPRLLLGAERAPESGSSEKNFATRGRKPGSLAPLAGYHPWWHEGAARGHAGDTEAREWHPSVPLPLPLL